MEHDEIGQGLPLEEAWRVWGPPEAVRELDVVGYSPAKRTINGPPDAAYEESVRIAPVKWLRNKIASGEFDLFAQKTTDWAEKPTKFPVDRAGELTLGADEWKLCCGNYTLYFPRLRRAEHVHALPMVNPASTANSQKKFRGIDDSKILAEAKVIYSKEDNQSIWSILSELAVKAGGSKNGNSTVMRLLRKWNAGYER